MFGNLSNNRKLAILAIGAFLMLLLMYRMAITRTLNRRQECKAIENTLQRSSESPKKIQALEIDLSSIQDIICANDENPEHIRQILLEKTSEYCQRNKIILIRIPEPVNVSQNDYIIQTNTMSFQGSFKNLLGLIYLFEQKMNVTRVVSADFHMVREARSRKMNLQLDIYVQNIKPDKQ